LIKLDYTLDNPEDRNKLVQEILKENPEPNDKYLEILADYLVLCMEKQEKKEKKILTENRMTTVDKREISFEGLVSQFENGEDGIYNLITNNKDIIF
jgi:ABC-type molybdate transport system substrate-binding protein